MKRLGWGDEWHCWRCRRRGCRRPVSSESRDYCEEHRERLDLKTPGVVRYRDGGGTGG